MDIFKPYIDFYIFYLKYKVDITSYLEAYALIQEYQNKYHKIQEKLKSLALKGNTKYSFLVSERENKITTTPDDLAYNLDVESFEIKRIIDVSIHVLAKQMNHFKNTLYKKYRADIIRFRKGVIDKNEKSIEAWKKIEDIFHV